MTQTTFVSPEAVQQAVDQAAHFNLYAVPDPGVRNVPIGGAGGGAVGIRAHQILHRLQVICRQPTTRTPITARNVVGEPVARLTHRWMVLADDAVPRIDRDPQPVALDSSRTQRFVMLETECRFINTDDGFRGFGTGLTLPFTWNGRPETVAMAVGTITEGFGRFSDHTEGTYVYCGQFSPQTGFTGNVFLRLMDRDETFRTDEGLPPINVRGGVERDTTYIIFRGQAVPSDPVTPRLGPEGRPNGLVVEQGLRILEVDAIGRGQPRSLDSVGPLVGRITANVTFNPAGPGGTIRDPIPFTAMDEFVFHDPESGRRIGSFTADSIEGRVFRTQVIGQPAIRFGGVGRIHRGHGVFAGIQGLMTDNSVVVFEPHVSASVYVLRLYDPEGRFSSRIDPRGVVRSSSGSGDRS